MRAFTLPLILTGLGGLSAHAAVVQEDVLFDMSLEDLLQLEVSVGSKTEAKPLRETPGIVTVITAEEIANSGARDLIDVLRRVPGFDFGLDVYEVVGVGARGNWVYEGKLLLLIDGIEMNERQYGTIPFGSHYPLDQIQRIEIIRGPGSVNYGGFAELGVINIITRTAGEIDGVRASLSYGHMQQSPTDQLAQLQYGKVLDNGVELSLAAAAGKSRRSDRDFVSFSGAREDMAENSHLAPHFVNLGLRYGGFSSRLLTDNYRTTNRNMYGEVEDTLWKVDFKSWDYQAHYETALRDNLQLELEAGYHHENAWHEDNGTPDSAVNILVQHAWAKSGFRYTLNERLKLAAGLELTSDRSSDDRAVDALDLPQFHNYTGYLEGDYRSDWGDLVLGLRYDRHSIFGTNLAPRVALTRVYENFHYKLLYSHSFRSPAVMNISYNPAIKPEQSEVWEAEAGYQFNPDTSLVVNVFDNKTNDIITYGVDPLSGEDNYFNADTSGTRGVEAEFRYQHSGHFLTLSHAYYQVAHSLAENQRVVDFQQGWENPDLSLGFPAHKTALSAHLKLAPEFSVNPSLVYTSARYGYLGLDAEDNPILHRYDPSLLVNVYFRYRPRQIEGLELGFGVYDLLAENPVFVQPYNGGSAPLPGPTREWRIKLSYRF